MPSVKLAANFQLDHLGHEEEQMTEEVKPRRTTKFCLVLFGFLIAAVIVVSVFLATTENSPFGNNSGEGSDKPQDPTPFPTKSPTIKRDLTLSPTDFPTTFPTKSPTTKAPTPAPSSSPTASPNAACVDPDSVCGCDLVVSELIDVIFIADKSGSVGAENYNKMKNAIKNFAANAEPPMNLENGTRIGYIEFSTAATVNRRISLTTFGNAEDFNDRLDGFSFTGGFTDQKKAMIAVEEMLNEPGAQLRNGSQLALVMLTDGNPCTGCGQQTCCPDPSSSGVTEIRALREIRDFTFYFLPLQPLPGFAGVDESIYDAVVGPNSVNQGLEEDELIKFPLQGFDQLNEFLNGDSFSFPLGPCVAPPTPAGTLG